MRKDMVVVASPTFVIENKGQQKEKIHSRRVKEAKKCAWVCIHCSLQVEKEDGDAQPGYHNEATRGKARGWFPFGECMRTAEIYLLEKAQKGLRACCRFADRGGHPWYCLEIKGKQSNPQDLKLTPPATV
jgi:hypothetical protein